MRRSHPRNTIPNGLYRHPRPSPETRSHLGLILVTTHTHTHERLTRPEAAGYLSLSARLKPHLCDLAVSGVFSSFHFLCTKAPSTGFSASAHVSPRTLVPVCLCLLIIFLGCGNFPSSQLSHSNLVVIHTNRYNFYI